MSSRAVFPVLCLAIPGLLAILFTFQDFGASWDEPLFYRYADEISQAYDISALRGGSYNLEKSYSLTDHRYYGPAYLLLARPLVNLLDAVRFPGQRIDHWHLLNALTFLAGGLGLYGLARRWMPPWAACWAALLFLSQPVLWGHGFMNPKDVPFMTLFILAVLTGLRMVDRLTGPAPAASLAAVVPAAIMLGLLSAVRVIGPLAGLLVALALLPRSGRHAWVGLALYAGLSILIMLLFWPFLWQSPAARLVEVLSRMAANPVSIAVQFNGQMIPSGALPRSYLPTLLGITLTLPVLPLAAFGLIGLVRDLRRGPNGVRAGFPGGSLALLVWLVLPLAYLLVFTPPLYDGYRHFFFILPPIFLLAGRGLAALSELARPIWQGRTAARAGFGALAAALLLPGLLGIVHLHPYAYTYFNPLTGGLAGAFRRYDTDYWLTCYKRVIEEQVNPRSPVNAKLYVLREPLIAALYTRPDITVALYNQGGLLPSGSLLLLTTRMNADQIIYPDAPVLYSEGAGGALFCVVKEIP